MSIFRTSQIGLFIFGWAALSVPAEAKVRATGVNANQQQLAACLNVDFLDYDDLKACFSAKLPPPNYVYWSNTGNGGFFRKVGGSCTAADNQEFGFYPKGYTWSLTGKILTARIAGPLVYKGSEDVVYAPTQSGCLGDVGAGDRANEAFAVSVTGEEEAKVCKLNAQWAGFGLPKRTVGYVPKIGDKFKLGYSTGFALPALSDGGGTTPGTLFSVNMDDETECAFRRETRIHVDDPDGGVGVMVYTVSYYEAGESTPPKVEQPEMPDIVVVGSRKVSKPIVSYGRPFNTATKKTDPVIESLVKTILELRQSCNGQCTTLDGQAVPVSVIVPQTDPRVPFNHPAPAQLARDNPACLQKYDPRCAWNPSTTQPATPQTPPNQLVRMSNDGQTIVHNDVTIYNNTIYPQAMRDAGTAPNELTPSSPSPITGDVDAPESAEDADGEEGELVSKCMSSGECTPSDAGVARYLEGIGVDANKDTSPDGIAAGIIDQALGDGTCASTSTNGFCSMASEFARRSTRPVPEGDLVIAEGDIRLFDRSSHQELTLNRTVLDYLKLLLKIMTIYTTIHIILRGRPY